MEMVGQLKERYEKYVQDVAQVFAKAKPADGLFGWGDDPKNDPCHMAFYEDVEKWVKAFQAAQPEQAAVFEAVRFMLETPAAYRGENCYWFMYAAQGLCRELIPGLSGQQCAGLRNFYDDNYPKRDRMPVQKEVYKLLKKGAGKA